MALIEYEWRGQTWQFDEADAPADAVPVEAAAVSEPVSEDEPGEDGGEAKAQTKRATARNKAASPQNK